MEITKAKIAGLVLGYLKSEKCYAAVDEFLEASPYFRENKQNIKMGHYFITRVAGMCLVDFLEEYASIYSIVQGRLEASNYYNEEHNRTSLVEQILYLLDKNIVAVANSTPVFSVTSEVDTTPVETLPGNNCSEESESSVPKTPKRKITRNKSAVNKSLDKDEAFDVSQVLTQTLLENHELHEKIAETINIVRNTPEVSKTHSDEHISAGASKELDAIIKTVVQRTEEDPAYNKLIDEIIGTTPLEIPPLKKSDTCSSSVSSQTPPCPNLEDPSKSNQINEKIENQSNSSEIIDDHNNDAVRSIIEASQNTQPPPVPPQNNEVAKPENSAEVYLFDGSLDTYLKSSGGANTMTPNPVYINTRGLFVMPPEPSKQFYIVNNQPLINMNVSAVKGMITDNDIMTMPTIIVNDETQATFPNHTYPVSTPSNKNPPKRNKTLKIAPKPTKSEVISSSESNVVNPPQIEATSKVKKSKTTKSDPINSIPNMGSDPSTVVVTASQTTPSVVTIPVTKAPTPRQASHVRNLDFSSPVNNEPETKKKAWDADLRSIVKNCVDIKTPTPKRKRPVTTNKTKKKAKPKKKVEQKLEKAEEKATVDETEETKTEKDEENLNLTPPELKPDDKDKSCLHTPLKDLIPKTPGIVTNNLHCTPFTEVLEEQLRGIDLISMPTPKISITPGFPITPGLNLTPVDIATYNNRSTDYSTSSSYYQPSDTEQNKSLEQLIEECRRLEENKPPLQQDKFSDLKILSDVVIEQAKIPVSQKTTTEEKKTCGDHLKKFNHNVIGKKNLSLLKNQESSSSSSDESDSSDSDSEKSGDHSNKTIIFKKDDPTKKSDAASISNIISSVEVKETLDEETNSKHILSQLEVVRKRTISKIKNPELTKKPVRNNRKTTQIKPKTTETKKTKTTKKKEPPPDESNTDEEAQKLVKGLAQRGIHLIPKKTPQKKKTSSSSVDTKSKVEKVPENTAKCEETAQKGTVIVDDSDVVFDRKNYEDVEIVVHEEKGGETKSLTTYDLGVLKKSFEARVFAEHLNEEVTRTMKWTLFETLIDIPSKINILTPRKTKQTEEEIENELMDYVFIGSVREESPETKQTTKGGKKRKSRLSEDESKQTEKKSKKYENNIKLLKKIDVDVFLDKVHGE